MLLRHRGLRFREIEVLRRNRQQVVVGAGLRPGERVCLSQLDTVTEGMQVRVLETTPPARDTAGESAEEMPAS